MDRKTVVKGKNYGNILNNKAARMRSHFSSCVKNVTNECVDVEASSSSERPSETDSNQNKRCLDTEFYEDDKPQLLHKKAMFLQGNINKLLFNCCKKFLCLQYII